MNRREGQILLKSWASAFAQKYTTWRVKGEKIKVLHWWWGGRPAWDEEALSKTTNAARRSCSISHRVERNDRIEQ